MTAALPADESPSRLTAVRRLLPQSAAAWAGSVLLVLVVGAALLGPWLAPHAPNQTMGIPFTTPGGTHLLGTDFLGRDVWSRVLSGGRSALFYAAIATVLAYAGGLTIGLLAGYSRGVLDNVTMRAVDVLMSFPTLVFVLLLATAVGNGVWPVVLATAVIQLPAIARIVRAATAEQAVRGFVEAAVVRGESTPAILRREILPNISRTIGADIGLRFTWSVLLIASVNFLGFGLQAPAADWGLMVSENRGGMATNPWAVLAPAAMLGLLTIAITLVSDAVTERRP